MGEIEVTGLNPRKDFDAEGLQRLAADIAQHGIIEPLVVTEDHRLIAGERRLRAAKLLGLKEVPVVVKKISDKEIQEYMLLENLQRKDLNVVEEAAGVYSLLNVMGMTQEDLAKHLGRSQSWISTRARIWELDEPLKEMGAKGHAGAEVLTEFLPFRGYPIMGPIIEGVLARLKDKDETLGGVIRLATVKETIDDVLENVEDKVLRLNRKEYEIGFEMMEGFNNKGCKKCPHVLKWVGEYDDAKHPVLYCLKEECFKPRLEDAEAKMKAKEAASAKKIHRGASTRDVPSYDYRPLTKQPGDWRDPEFDRTECKDCDDSKMVKEGKKNVRVCSKTGCWERKQNAAKKAIQAHHEALEKLVIKNVDQVLDEDELTEKQLRFMLGAAAAECGSATGALKAWIKKIPSDNMRLVADSVPKKDLWKALAKVLIENEAKHITWGRSSEQVLEFMEKYLPELLEGAPQMKLAGAAAVPEEEGEGEDGEDEDQEGA